MLILFDQFTGSTQVDGIPEIMSELIQKVISKSYILPKHGFTYISFQYSLQNILFCLLLLIWCSTQAREGNLNEVKRLLSQGENVNATDRV